MKYLLLSLFSILTLIGWSQPLNTKAIDLKKNNQILVGLCNREGFATINSNFDSAYKAEYPLYQPDMAVLNQIRDNLKSIKITLVMGTWCGDSRDWVPRFYKIMDMAGFNYKNLTLICVDRERKAGKLDISTLKIDRVPTFIVYKKKKETGRIVEVPSDLLEKDLLNYIIAK